MENEAIKFAGSIELNEYRKLNFYGSRKRIIVVHAVYFVFIFCLSLIVTGQLIGSLIFSIAFTLILWLIIMFIVSHKVKGEYKSNQLMKQEIQYMVNHDGVTQIRGVSKMFYKWKELMCAYEYKDIFRIQISKNQNILIPKRFFVSNDDSQKFIRLIFANMPVNKVKIRRVNG